MERGSGKPVPALSRKPDIPEDMEWIWEAYWVLHRSRDIGFGPGFIKLSEIAAYLEIFPTRNPAFFVTCIQELDRVYLEDYNKKKSKPKNAATGSAGSGKANHGRRGRTRTKGK
jgi:hypothetical protein